MSARLVGAQGAALDPSQLRATEITLDDNQLKAVRDAASRTGRFLERDGLLVAGLGEEATIELPGGLGEKAAARAAGTLLAAVSHEAPARPVAIGALPFLPDRAAMLTLPRLSLRIEGDRQSVVVVSRTEETPDAARLVAELATPTTRHPSPPERFRLTPVGSHASFRRRVGEALREIGAGNLDKVVLAREVTVHADKPFRPEHLLRRLRQLHPSCLTFSVDGILGASPELLARVHGEVVTSQPLAGTVGRSGDPEQDRQLAASLLSSDKERAEHNYVVEAICDALAPFVVELDVPETPHLMELRNVVHLATTIVGRLGIEAPGCLELAAALHPTPAVCGSPRDAALELLRRTEQLDRDRYAGPVGFIDSEGDGEFWLAIRSAMIDGHQARLLAGVGIVSGSVPEDELAETQLKLQALLAAAVRP